MRELFGLIVFVSLVIVIFRIPVEAPLKKVVKASTVLFLDAVGAVQEGVREHSAIHKQ